MRSASLVGLLPLFALAACTPEPLKGLDTGDTDLAHVNDDDGGSDGLDTSTDTAPPLDTDFTLDTDGSGQDTGGGFFNPVAATMYVEFGVNTDGQISDFRMQGVRNPPRFVVQLTNVVGSVCVMEYDLNSAAFNTWLANGTTPPADFKLWLPSQGLYIGMALATGLYTALPVGCSLDPARWTADPHAAFLAGEWDFGIDDAMPAAVQTLIDANGGLVNFYGAGWDPATALGGFYQVPAGYFGTNPLRNMEAYGFAAEADAAMNVTILAATSSVLPVPAADIYNDATGDFQPVFVRLFSMYQINF